MFEIPVVLFFFKREDKTLQVLARIAEVRPRTLYLFSDGPRNEEEARRVMLCRQQVEQRIDWPCTLIRNYAETNQGVYRRIGLGARWVLEREPSAIFLEDDNLPETSFFPFCEELLRQYAADTRVLWICGTNYLTSYPPEDGASYVFTQHVLPCGWASWSHKFSTFYDGGMELWKDERLRNRVLDRFASRALARQWRRVWTRDARLLEEDIRAVSWDGQMAFSLMAHNLLGIAPAVNLILNIGVDLDSEHGGVSFANTMTERFCAMPSLPMSFPLRHPRTVLTDRGYEDKVGRIILLPLRERLLQALGRSLKRILGMDQATSLSALLKRPGKR